MLDSARDHSFCHDELDNRRTLILTRPLIATRPDKFLIIAKASSHSTIMKLRATECPTRVFASTLGKNISQAKRIGSRELSSTEFFSMEEKSRIFFSHQLRSSVAIYSQEGATGFMPISLV